MLGAMIRPALVRYPLAGAAALVLAACTSASTIAGQASTPATASRHSQAPSPSPTPSHRAHRPARPLPVAPGQASLPQTMARPAARGRAFHAMVTDLWLAVRTGKPALGRLAFFPVSAYKQVKAIVDPAADWQSRLWGDFVLDVKAAHALLGPDAKAARLVTVLVANQDAAWIVPGVCYNRVGYWHVANSRVVYRLHGAERSFGIASLISWRGVWYVVHFGGVVRPAVGMVDAPSAGPGVVGPQGGC
jgi:hypothetical protein